MPFAIRFRGGQYEVVTKGGPRSGHVHGKFKTRAEAVKQLRALYANVPEARS